MIDHKHRVVFIHIPKTAGYSIYDFFHSTDHGHKTLEEHRGWGGDYFKFTFIRNPFDRFVSAYTYFKKYGKNNQGNDHVMGNIINEFGSFKDFVHNFSSIKDRFVSRHFLPQVFWISRDIDYIGRFECINKDFNTICDRLNIEYKPLQLINSSKHKYYADYYDNETYNIIKENYKIDLETFKYKF